MQDYFDTEFWDIVHTEYGVTDELDILSENVTEIITPVPGLIVLILKEFYGKESCGDRDWETLINEAGFGGEYI